MSPGSLCAAASSFTSQESRQWWQRSAFMASVGARDSATGAPVLACAV